MWVSCSATLSNISLRKGTIGKEEQSCQRYIHANIKLAGKNIPRKWHSGITRGSNTPYEDVFPQYSNDQSIPITYPPIFYNFSKGGPKGTSRHAGKGTLLDFLHRSFVCYVWALRGLIFPLRPINSIKRQIYLLTAIKDSKNLENQLGLLTFDPFQVQIGSKACHFPLPFCSRISPFVLIKRNFYIICMMSNSKDSRMANEKLAKFLFSRREEATMDKQHGKVFLKIKVGSSWIIQDSTTVNTFVAVRTERKNSVCLSFSQ